MDLTTEALFSVPSTLTRMGPLIGGSFYKPCSEASSRMLATSLSRYGRGLESGTISLQESARRWD
jgi:hypothetical protein